MEDKKKAVVSDALKHIREIQKLTAKKKKTSVTRRKGERFWNRDKSSAIFNAHPDSARAILYKSSDRR